MSKKILSNPSITSGRSCNSHYQCWSCSLSQHRGSLLIRYSNTKSVRTLGWKRENLPSVEENHVKKHLNNLGIHKWIGSDGINPHVRGKVIPPQDHSQVSLKSCGDQEWLMWAGRKEMSLITSKRARRKYRLVSHTSIPWNKSSWKLLPAILGTWRWLRDGLTSGKIMLKQHDTFL